MTTTNLHEVMEIEKELFSSPWLDEMFVQEMELHDAFVCVSENNVVGYICGWNIIDEYHITNVGVGESYQHQGIASFMLEKLISLKIDEGMKFFFLEVRESNYKAISLYTKFCFEIIGKRKKYYSDPEEDALLMGFFPYGKPNFI